MKILDVGCGKNKYKGDKKDKVVGLDIVKLPCVDKVHDLEKFPWPFQNNEFDLVICNHTLEHFSSLVKTMEEIWRVGKPNSTIKIKVPYFAHPGAFWDPTHKVFFTTRTFDYFTEESKFNYYSRARFKILSQKIIFMVNRPRISKLFEFFININPTFYERFLSRVFPAEQLFVELRVIK